MLQKTIIINSLKDLQKFVLIGSVHTHCQCILGLAVESDSFYDAQVRTQHGGLSDNYLYHNHF